MWRIVLLLALAGMPLAAPGPDPALPRHSSDCTAPENRERLSGYKVIFVPFRAGEPSGMPEDVLIGFVEERGEARGRPVGVAVDRAGALLVADDVGNCVWRVTAARASR